MSRAGGDRQQPRELPGLPAGRARGAGAAGARSGSWRGTTCENPLARPLIGPRSAPMRHVPVDREAPAAAYLRARPLLRAGRGASGSSRRRGEHVVHGAGADARRRGAGAGDRRAAAADGDLGPAADPHRPPAARPAPRPAGLAAGRCAAARRSRRRPRRADRAARRTGCSRCSTGSRPGPSTSRAAGEPAPVAPGAPRGQAPRPGGRAARSASRGARSRRRGSRVRRGRQDRRRAAAARLPTGSTTTLSRRHRRGGQQQGDRDRGRPPHSDEADHRVAARTSRGTRVRDELHQEAVEQVDDQRGRTQPAEPARPDAGPAPGRTPRAQRPRPAAPGGRTTPVASETCSSA